MDRRRTGSDEPSSTRRQGEPERTAVDVALGMVSGTAGAAASLATSNALISAAAVAFVQTVSQRLLGEFRGWIDARRQDRVSAVLQETAKMAELEPDELLER